MEEYLCDPCGENLLALGEDRNSILLNYLSGRSHISQEARVASLYVKVTSDYDSVDSTVQRVVESVVGEYDNMNPVQCLLWFLLWSDAILQPVFQENLALGLIDEILIQIGLLKVNFFPPCVYCVCIVKK